MLNAEIQGSGSPVVLLHPVGLDAPSWQAVAGLLRTRHTVISVDLRGHGGSPPVSPAMTLSDYAADVAALIRAQDRAPAVVIGLSFGGMIAHTLAIEYPELLRGAVVGGCPCDFTEAQRQMVRQRGEKAMRDGMSAIIDETITRWFTPAFIAAGRADGVRKRLLDDEPVAWASAWSAISGLATHAQLARVRVPTLCVAGGQDAACPVVAVKEIATQIPGAEFVVIPDAPHMMQIETPDSFVRTITPFVQRLAPVASHSVEGA